MDTGSSSVCIALPPISGEQQGGTGVVSLEVLCKEEGRCYSLDADSSSKALVLKPCSWWQIIGRGEGLSVEALRGNTSKEAAGFWSFHFAFAPWPWGRDFTLPRAAVPPPET